MKEFFTQIVAGYFCSFVGGICFALVYTGITKLGIDIDYGGDKSQVFFSLFIGLPIGSLVGFLLAQKIVAGVWCLKIIPAVVGCVLSLICVIGSVPLLDIFGGWMLYACPLFSTLGFIIAYKNIVSFFK